MKKKPYFCECESDGIGVIIFNNFLNIKAIELILNRIKMRKINKQIIFKFFSKKHAYKFYT